MATKKNETRTCVGLPEEEKDLRMVSDSLEVQLDGFGTTTFKKENRGKKKFKSYGDLFMLDGLVINGCLFAECKKGTVNYSIQFCEVKTNRFVTTLIPGSTDDASAIHAIETGWDEFRKKVKGK